MLLTSDNDTLEFTPNTVRGIRSAGEENRLILSHSVLIKPIAAKYRGSRGIPFDDLMAEGMAGLVSAARVWAPPGRFPVYASVCIRNAIVTLIDRWQPLVSAPDIETEPDFWEWAIWSHVAPYEQWTTLAADPDELMQNFADIIHDRMSITSAMIGLDRRDRAIVQARFFREPPQSLQSIAREHKISYSRVVFLLKRALCKIRETIERQA